VTILEFVRREIVQRAGATPRVVEVLDVVDDSERVIDFRGPAFAVTFRRGPGTTISLTESSVLVAPAASHEESMGPPPLRSTGDPKQPNNPDYVEQQRQDRFGS